MAYKIILPSLLSLVLPVQALDLYISPNGSDTNSGTKNEPLATLHAAQKKSAISLWKRSRGSTLTVWLSLSIRQTDFVSKEIRGLQYICVIHHRKDYFFLYTLVLCENTYIVLLSHKMISYGLWLKILGLAFH